MRQLAAELVSINNCITSRIAYVDTTNPENFVNGSMPVMLQSNDKQASVIFDPRE